MKLTESEYLKLRPIIIELSHKRGHPQEITLGELSEALKVAGLGTNLGEAYEDFAKLHFRDLPIDCTSAVTKILDRLEQEVFECTGRYPAHSD